MILPKLEDVLPHRPPMVLIDAITAFDPAAATLEATVTIRPDAPFHAAGGVPSWVAIEYMAQTAAALAGCADLATHPNESPRPGLLLGTRRLTLDLDHFADGVTYRIRAENSFCADDAAAFACTIFDPNGAVVATASLNAYRPPDFIGFLKGQDQTPARCPGLSTKWPF